MVTNQTHGRPLQIIDTTLRDGEQAVGVSFTVREKMEIAARLSELGVSEIEVGCPASGKDEMDAIEAVVDMNLPSRVIGWCRACEHDLQCAHACGLTAVHVSLPASSIHIQTLDKTEQWVFEQIDRLIPHARQMFDYVSVGLQDASRASLAFLQELTERCHQAGADRVRLADTVGVWDPITTYETMRAVRRHTGRLHLGFHGHNDLGMATANTLAAIRAGADCVDVTVNGLGERAGNAPLDEVVMGSQVCLNRSFGIDTRRLIELAVMVEKASGRALPVNKPVSGRGVFLHESGVHVHAMIRDRSSYEPFDPSSIGRMDSQFVLGKHSGRAALRAVLMRQGLSVDDRQEEILLELIRKASVMYKSPVSDEQLKAFHQKIA